VRGGGAVIAGRWVALVAALAGIAPAGGAAGAGTQPRRATGAIMFHVVYRSEGAVDVWDWEAIEGFGEMQVRLEWRDGAWVDAGSKYVFRVFSETGDQGWGCEHSGNTEGAIREWGPLTPEQDAVQLVVTPRSNRAELRLVVSTTGAPWVVGEAPRDECAAPRPWVEWGQALACTAGRLGQGGRVIRFDDRNCATVLPSRNGDSVDLQAHTLSGRIALSR